MASPRNVTRGVIHQFLAATIASISVIILGTSLGWPSPVLPKLEETGIPIRLTNSEISWMVSLLYLGNLASPIPSGLLMDKFGRKNSLLLLSIFPVCAWIMILYATKAYLLYIARFLAGVWSGTVSTIVPMYLAEISEPKIRGALSTFIQIMTNFGVLYEYIIGPLVSYYILAIISGIIPIIFAILFVFMAESPYWLLMKKKRDKAIKSLTWLRDIKDKTKIEEELNILTAVIDEEMNNKKSYKDIIRTKGNRKGLIIVEALAILQRMSGISALMAYTSTTLPKEGVGILTPNDCVIVMGITWVICVFIATILVDSLGRKPLLIFSSIGCTFAMFIAGLWFFIDEKTIIDVKTLSWLPFAAFIFYGICFSIGLGPIASTIQGELFPTNVKGIASGITSIILALTSFIMNKIYHSIAEIAGMYLNYWIFAIASLISTIFVIFYVFETKGKTLAEIQEKLNKNVIDL
ncbi:hypothetical protein O3M35_004701 [Rhynocoris fuscipes]|uniref:Major facilitator superfamily (MFS) profile domain-containing protein n=1 Tax=Rhynocoris fuscipes TaxID=488301 RepID=A0AAW1CIT7_9HEMI